jgi:hypothetical protein
VIPDENQVDKKSHVISDENKQKLQDNKMTTAFYQNLQQRVDVENEDSDNEEGRNEN